MVSWKREVVEGLAFFSDDSDKEEIDSELPGITPPLPRQEM